MHELSVLIRVAVILALATEYEKVQAAGSLKTS